MSEPKPRLLVVDDDVNTGTLFRRIAEGEGYEVLIATRADQARAGFTAFDPHVVILDMIMPDADGPDVLAWICNAGFRGRMILVSGFSDEYLEDAAEMAREGGIPDARPLPKPVAIADLRAALARPPRRPA